MVGCSIFGCKSNNQRKESGVTFHSFPTEEKTRNQWLAKIGKKDWVPQKYSRICSKHFEENCFHKTQKQTLIKKSSIPTLFLHDSSGNDSTVSDNTLNDVDHDHLHIACAIPNKHENPLDEDIKLESNADVPTNSEVPFSEYGFVASSLIGRPEAIEDIIKIEDNQDASNNLEVCRVCLAVDRKMFELKNRKLKQAYTQLTGFSVCSHDGLPQRLCWECASRVLSAVKLYDRAKRAHTILSALLAKGSISMKDIRSVNREQMKLMTSLSCEYFKHTQYHNIIEGNIIEIKKSDNFDDSTEMYLNIDDIGRETEDVDDQDDKYESEIDEHDNDVKTDLNDQDDIMKDVDSTKSIKKSNEILKEPSEGIKQRKLKRDSNNKGKDGISKLQEFFTITAVKLEDAIAAVQSRKHSEAYINGLFKCEVCYRGYSTKSHYEVHALKHTEKFGNIECPVCKFRYKRTHALTCHMLSHHRKKYRCKQCDFVTNARTTADNHYKFHAGDIYKCPHCPKQFNQKTSYYSHMRIKHACSFACEMCGHTFLSASGVEQHKRRRHVLDDLSIEGPFCETCDVTFATRAAYDTHLLMSSRHNNDNQRSITNAYQTTPRDFDADGRTRRRRPAKQRVTCEQCGVALDSVLSYAHHFRKLHPTETRAQHVAQRRGAPAVCELCGKTFHCMASLKSHMPVHTGVGFKCDDCGKTFMGKFNLYLHRKLHEPSRPTYPCDTCGKRFSSSGNLKRHIRSHTNATPFECEACGKRLTTRAGLQAHIDHVHSGRPWPKRLRHRP